MALDIKALARTAFVLAKDLAAQAFETVTIRINPTVTIDVSDDSESTAWESSTSVSALRFDESDEKIAALPKSRLKNFLVDVQDLPAGLALEKIDSDAELVDGDGIIWEVYQSEVDPSGSAAIFYCRRGIDSTP